MAPGAPSPWQTGTHFSRYEIDSRLAVGGMAEVWRAKIKGARGFEKRIVIKTMQTQLAARPDMVQMFIDAVSREQQRPLQGLGPGSLPILLRHLWPGNVRELESVVRAACQSTEAQWLRPIDLVILPLEPPHAKDGEPAIPENYTLDGVIRRHILQVLKACDGNKARAASKLGISRSTLYRMLETDIAMPLDTPEVKHDELLA